MTDTQTPATIPATDRAALALGSSETEKHLAALSTKHANITEVKDKTGREQAHGAYMELTRARTTVEKAAKEARDDATKFSKAVIAEAARLVAIVEPEETRLKSVRDAWDTEQARIKREAEEAERARVLALGARIQEIRSYVALANTCRGSNSLHAVVIKGLEAIDMSGFAEFEDEAKTVMADTLRQAHVVLESRLAAEAEAERLKVEREELARQQAQAKQKADELAAQQKAEADKLAAERAEFARQQQEATDKMAAQQAEIERQRAELEAAKAREQEEAAKAERQRAHAAQVEADRIAREQAEAVSASRIRDELIAKPPTAAEVVEKVVSTMGLSPESHRVSGLANEQGEQKDDAPPAASLINCVAEAYGVDAETACQWLCARAAEIEAFAAETETA